MVDIKTPRLAGSGAFTLSRSDLKLEILDGAAIGADVALGKGDLPEAGLDPHGRVQGSGDRARAGLAANNVIEVPRDALAHVFRVTASGAGVANIAIPSARRE